jgi:hypothetical protein
MLSLPSFLPQEVRLLPSLVSEWAIIWRHEVVLLLSLVSKWAIIWRYKAGLLPSLLLGISCDPA